MRTLSLSAALLVANGPLAFAQEHAAPAGGGGLMSIQVNLMFWTLLIFVILYFILSKFAFGPITKAVEAREKALEDAIEGAKHDRDAAAKLLGVHPAHRPDRNPTGPHARHRHGGVTVGRAPGR